MHRQTSFFILILILILTSSLIMTKPVTSSPADTILKFDPSAVSADPDNSFEIEVAVSDTPPLYTWQFRLRWNASLLELQNIAEGTFLKQGGVTTLFAASKINQTEGWADVLCTRTGVDTPGVAGSGELAKVTFLVELTGDCSLNLTATKLIKPGYKGYDQPLYLLPHRVENGFFTTSAHDVAVTNITVSKTQITPGEVITISVTVENQGVFSETFNITLYYDTKKITLLNVTDLQASTSQIVAYDWNTTGLGPGDFVLKAQASFVSLETDKTDNTRFFEKISTPRHDRAVTSITASPKQVNLGENVTVNIVVSNIGNYEESFTVALYYDSTWITNLTVTNLQPGNTQTLTYIWDTTGVPKGDYQLKAKADVQPEEPYTKNNELKILPEDSISIGTPEQSFPMYLVVIAIGAAVAVIVIVALLMRRRSKPAPA